MRVATEGTPFLTAVVERSVAPATTPGVAEAPGGALAGIEHVRIELRFGGFTLEVHARSGQILALIGLDGRAAPGRKSRKDREQNAQL